MLTLIVANLVCTSAMFGIIWMVQLVHYPMLSAVEAESFPKWHEFHSNRISWIVAPLMVGELGLSIWLAWADLDLAHALPLLFTSLIWAFTFFVSVRIHNDLGRLGAGLIQRTELDHLLTRLVQTNWPRSIFYTLKMSSLIALYFFN